MKQTNYEKEKAKKILNELTKQQKNLFWLYIDTGNKELKNAFNSTIKAKQKIQSYINKNEKGEIK